MNYLIKFANYVYSQLGVCWDHKIKVDVYDFLKLLSL